MISNSHECRGEFTEAVKWRFSYQARRSLIVSSTDKNLSTSTKDAPSPRYPQNKLCCQETAEPPTTSGATFVWQWAPSEAQGPLLLFVGVKRPEQVHHIAIHLSRTRKHVTEQLIQSEGMPHATAGARQCCFFLPLWISVLTMDSWFLLTFKQVLFMLL